MGHTSRDQTEPEIREETSPASATELGRAEEMVRNEIRSRARVRLASWSTAKREHSLFSLLELSNELTVSLDLYEIADVALFNIMGHFATSRIALWVLPDEPMQSAVLVRSHGVPTSAGRGMGAEWTRWLMSEPDVIPEPVLVSELEPEELTTGLSLAKQCGLELIAPVPARGQVFGVIGLGRRVSGESFRSRDLELLNASVSLLGVSIENTKLYNRMVENNRQLRQANEQLQELDNLKSEFMRNMNHEIRTPLTIMIAYLEGLVGDTEDGSERREHMQVVQEQAMKLEGMLANLLDFSDVVGGGCRIKSSPGDVRRLLESYFEDRRPGVTAGLREFRLSCPRALPIAVFDPARLSRVLDCLVDNAVKFTPQGSHIRLRAEVESQDDNPWVRIDLQDDGPGIPPDRLHRIFESFSQADGSTTRKFGGMGVGLSLARRLAEGMKARVDVTSAIGQGTTFSLRLPVR
jgi:signal transduction histidine kinase